MSNHKNDFRILLKNKNEKITISKMKLNMHVIQQPHLTKFAFLFKNLTKSLCGTSF